MFKTNSKYEILTPSGWQNFEGIKQSFKQTLLIYMSNGKTFECTLDHILCINKKLVIAKTLKPKDAFDKNLSVVKIKLYRTVDVYDPVNVANGHIYISDNLTSHNCSFLGSSSTLLSSTAISNFAGRSNILSTVDGLDILEQPKIGHNYTITVDPSKGVGQDYSVFVVIDTTNLPYRLVGKFRNNSISPILFPSVISKIATQFNEAWILIETNVSEQVPHILYYDIGYENIFTIARGKQGQYLSGGFSSNSKLGLQTDKKTKLLGCNNLKIFIEEGKLEIFDNDTIAELSTFIDNGKGSYAADDGYHDDLVMALVIFGWLTTQQYFKDMANVDIRARIYEDRMRAIEEEMLPPGFFNDGSEEEVFMKF